MTEKNQDPKQVFDHELQVRLNNNLFECHLEEIQFMQTIAAIILEELSLDRLRCDIDAYERLVSFYKLDANEISLLDASYLLNGINFISPKQAFPESHDAIQKHFANMFECNLLAKKWNAQVTPMKTSLMREIQAKAERKIILPKSDLKIHK